MSGTAGHRTAGRSVYIVTNFADGGNDRIRKVLRLREHFARMTVVAPDTPEQPPQQTQDTIVLRRRVNPFGVFRVLGLQRLKAAIERWCYFPSVSVLFIPKAVAWLSVAIEKDLADGRSVTVLTVAPPHALGIVGLRLKGRYPSIRWVIDWQDLWSHDENYFHLTPKPLRSRLLRLEASLLDRADLNLTTNDNAALVLQQEFGVAATRTQAIPHHFDRSDFDNAPSADPLPSATPDTVRIGFLGTLFKPPRVPGQALIDHLTELREQGVPVELHLHGLLTQADQRRLETLPGVFWHGHVSHEQSLAPLARYDYLLLLLADLTNCRSVLSIKLPHYMIAERPILALVPSDSAVAASVRETGTGIVIGTEGDWGTELMALLRQGKEAKLPARHAEQIERYSWERIASRWQDALSP